MSAKAKATTSAATSCCESRSPSGRWRVPSRQPCRALANRPALQQAGQEADPRKQRMSPLPWLQLDVRARVAVDLPGDIFGAACEGEARLREPGDRQKLPFQAPPRPPTLFGWLRGDRGHRGSAEPRIAVGIDIDD